MTLGAKRLARLKQFDPNIGVTNPMDFTLTGLEGEPFNLDRSAARS